MTASPERSQRTDRKRPWLEHYDYWVPHHTNYPRRPLYEILRRAAAEGHESTALSFLGAGVQPPETSWGTLLDSGVERIATAPHLTIIPGLMLVATVLSLNVFGDGVRDAFDPRAKVRIEH